MNKNWLARNSEMEMLAKCLKQTMKRKVKVNAHWKQDLWDWDWKQLIRHGILQSHWDHGGLISCEVEMFWSRNDADRHLFLRQPFNLHGGQTKAVWVGSGVIPEGGLIRHYYIYVRIVVIWKLTIRPLN